MRKCQPAAKRHLGADDAVAAVEFMLGREHVHRPALALGNARFAAGQFGHDDLGVEAVGEHVPMVAVTGDDAVLVAVERRLEADRDRFLADVEMAEPADQAEAIELPRALLETADQQHLLVEVEHLLLARREMLVLLKRFLQRMENEVVVLCGRLRSGLLAPGGFCQDFGSLFFRGGISLRL